MLRPGIHSIVGAAVPSDTDWHFLVQGVRQMQAWLGDIDHVVGGSKGQEASDSSSDCQLVTVTHFGSNTLSGRKLSIKSCHGPSSYFSKGATY